ncbi:hypothetical protein ABK040_012965 [Willaertia magna]
MNKLLTVLVALLLTIVFVVTGATPACECNFKDISIQDNDSLNKIIELTAKDFLSKVAIKKFNRLDVTILLPTSQDKKQWIRGTFNPRELSYPCSCVKLAFLVTSLNYCKNIKKLNYDCIDSHAHPMIAYSDNLETGFVVDRITETTNIYNLTSANDPRFAPWFKKRNSTNEYLDSLNLLGNQNFASKTYPTNSGDMPLGAENVLRQTYGGNVMQSCCAASLMLHTMYRLPNDEANYARKLLYHRRFDDWSAISVSLPPGTLLHNKIGNAYNDINDIAHFILPNGKEVILTVLSNGYQRSSDTTILGRFTELLLSNLGLFYGLPPIILQTIDNANSYHLDSNNWKLITNSSNEGVDRIGNSFMVLSPNPSPTNFYWDVEIPEFGLYEVTVYSPSLSMATNSEFSLPVTVNFYEGSASYYSYPIRFSSWTKIGDFLFDKGMNKNAVVVNVPGNYPQPVVINAIKFSKYPNSYPEMN